MSGNSTEPIQGDDASGSDKEPANRENEGEASLKPKPSHVSDRMWMVLIILPLCYCCY